MINADAPQRFNSCKTINMYIIYIYNTINIIVLFNVYKTV